MAWIKIADRSTYWERTNTNTANSEGDYRNWWSLYYDNNQDITNNRTKIKIDYYIQIYLPNEWSRYAVNGSSNAKIDGANNTITYPYSGASGYWVGLHLMDTVEIWVSHDAEGKKTFQFQGVGGGDFTKSTAISNYGLPQIPRVSSISNNTSTSSRKDFGTSVAFTIDRKSSSFTHNLSYVVNGTTYSIGTGIGTSANYTFPTSLINQFTGTATPTINVKCETFNGGTKIGEANTTVYLNVPSSYVPTCSLSIEDTNSITSGWGIWVKSRSILKGIITASGVSGSTISGYLSTVESQTFNTTPFEKTITTSGSVSISSTVTDSRGRQASDSETITVLDYTVPTFTSISVKRCLSNGTLDEFGTYGKVVCEYNITSLDNNNAKSLKVKLGATEQTFTLSNYSGTITATTAQLFSGLAIDTTYNFTFELTDSFTTTSQTTMVTPSFVLESDRAGGKGKTLGRIATEDGFFVYMESHFETIPNLWDAVNDEWIPFVEFEEI